MPVTRTTTSTKTFTRMALMKLQIERVLLRTRIEKPVVEKILSGIEKKWLSEILLYGIDQQERCHAELSMKIDWARNELHVKAGKDEVRIDSRWQNDLAIEVEKTLALFEDYTSECGLSVVAHVRYAPSVDRANVNSTLGFVDAKPIPWARSSTDTSMTIPELNEFTVGIRLVD